MNIDRYKVDGIYKKGDSEYEDPVDFIQASILDFCCCGCAEDNLKYVRDVLEYIDWIMKQPKGFDKWDGIYAEWIEKGKVLFSNEGAKYFAFYVMHTKGLTEHGGSVPGWLTVEGDELLRDLNELFPKDEKTKTEN
jgi:hypothetical protein